MRLLLYYLSQSWLGKTKRWTIKRESILILLLNRMKKERKCQWGEGEKISPWEDDEAIMQSLNYFSELPQRKKSTNLPQLSRRKICSNLEQYPNLRTLQRQSIRKSLKEINIKFHCHQGPPNNPRGQKQQLSRNSDGTILQQVNIKNFIVGGGEVTKERKKKRQSTYILKQKFATIRRSMVLMSQNKENTAKSLRYDF